MRRPDRLTRLARAIEAVGERDRRLLDESVRMDALRARGAAQLHGICRAFVDALNGRLPEPAVTLDPARYGEPNYDDARANLFQIGLRGRLLQLEFAGTEEVRCTEEFPTPYILEGALRAFNQDQLDRNTVDEKSLFFCPEGSGGEWYSFDCRTYRSGRVTSEFLAGELENLL